MSEHTKHTLRSMMSNGLHVCVGPRGIQYIPLISPPPPPFPPCLIKLPRGGLTPPTRYSYTFTRDGGGVSEMGAGIMSQRGGPSADVRALISSAAGEIHIHKYMYILHTYVVAIHQAPARAVVLPFFRVSFLSKTTKKKHHSKI